MKDRNFGPKYRTQAPREHRRQRYFGDQHQCRASGLKSVPHGSYIDLGLAAASYPMKQERLKIAVIVECRTYLIESRRLLGRECELVALGQGGSGERVTHRVLNEDLDDAVFSERVDRR